jgi:uncharacterized membrane protein YfcA
MDILIVSLVAFMVAIMTFFSGFGLGTILTPVFMVFFPTDPAIAGAYIGNKLLKKVTLRFLQVTVAIMLIVLSLALGLGVIK